MRAADRNLGKSGEFRGGQQIAWGERPLTILPHPALAVGGNGGNDCQTVVRFQAAAGGLRLGSSSLGDGDHWFQPPPTFLPAASSAVITAEGGALGGCGFQAAYVAPGGSRIIISMLWQWGAAPAITCEASSPYQCAVTSPPSITTPTVEIRQVGPA